MHTMPSNWTIHPHDWVDSTNLVADDLAREGAREGTVVMAQGQRAGKGRWGRSWESAFGKNLYISIVLRPHIVPDQVAVLTLVAGLAALEMLKEDYGVATRLKWPNDLCLKEKKLGGILTELHTEGTHVAHVAHVVVGLGLNVNAAAPDFSPEVAGSATSLYMAMGKAFSVREMAANWCFHLEHCYHEFTVDGFGGMQKEYEAVMALKGEKVRIDGVGPDVIGVVSGVDTQGRLLLRVGAEIRAIEAGEVVKICC